MISRNWFFLPVPKLRHVQNVEVRILLSSFPHSVQEHRFLIPFPLSLHPEGVEAQASVEDKIFFRSEERVRKDPASMKRGLFFG